MARIAINGLGRIGKLVLRALIDDGTPGEIVLLNDRVGDPATHAHLFEFDSVHGRWPARFAHDETGVSVNDHRMTLADAGRIEDLPLADFGIDLVIDCTGVFKTVAKTRAYFDAGVTTVIVAAPIKTGRAEPRDRGQPSPLRSRGIAWSARHLHDELPRARGQGDARDDRHPTRFITTIHDVTNTQMVVDRPPRTCVGRAGVDLADPDQTGSATAIALIYPELAGRLNGHAIRVPLLNASLTDCVFEMERPTTVDEVNGLPSRRGRKVRCTAFSASSRAPWSRPTS